MAIYSSISSSHTYVFSSTLYPLIRQSCIHVHFCKQLGGLQIIVIIVLLSLWSIIIILCLLNNWTKIRQKADAAVALLQILQTVVSRVEIGLQGLHQFFLLGLWYWSYSLSCLEIYIISIWYSKKSF